MFNEAWLIKKSTKPLQCDETRNLHNQNDNKKDRNKKDDETQESRNGELNENGIWKERY